MIQRFQTLNLLRMPFSAMVLLCLFLFAQPLTAETRVVTSIKPIELLVLAIATDDTQVSSLVKPGDSPHNYSLRPSQRRELEKADAIFWVGPAMETFLARLLSGDDFDGRVFALTDMPAEPASSDHTDDHAHEHHHHDHDEGEDPHVWLDPDWALAAARDIHSTLASLPDADKARLDANLAAFEQTLAETEQQISERLSAVKNIDLFTYHNAFTHFADHYGLSLKGVLTLNPELSPGAKHVAEVQQKLREANQPCLMTEPQFNRSWWRSITEGLNVTITSWDPLATDIEAGPDAYIQFQNQLADAAMRCL